ncbi:MAG: response regulator [Myxococcales bacterium]|nr:response regulator [Myxococcales bacterium]
MDVLVVDDDAVALEALCDLLQMDGFRPSRARSSQEAVDRLSTLTFRAVVTNLELRNPGAMAVVRAAVAQPGARVFVITTYVGSPEARNALAQGARRVFSKPLRYNLLAAELASATSAPPKT